MKAPMINSTTRIILTAGQFEQLRTVMSQIKWATADEETGRQVMYLSEDDKQLAERIATLFYRAGHGAQLEMSFEQDDK